MRGAPNKVFWIRCSCLIAATITLVSLARTVLNSAQQASSEVPLPVFTDITQHAGLTMKIINGDDTTEFLTDVNGTGACFLDYNNDGFQDIFLVNGTSRKSEAAGLRSHDYLLRNNGD